MDLINPNHSEKNFVHNLFTHINPLVVVPPKTGAIIVAVIDLILTAAAVICGIVLEVYLINPAAFGTTNEEDEFLGNEYKYTVTAMKKIYIFLVFVGILIIALSEYGLFTLLRDGIRRNDKNLCGTWFEIRFAMLCVLLGISVTYGLIMRAETFESEIGAAIPFFIYKLYALWIVKHCQYNLVSEIIDSELKVELIG